MNAPPFPLNPSVGERFGNWVWNGSRWVSSASAGMQVIVTNFSTVGSAPYNPSPGLVSVQAECFGGGGGGGSVYVATANDGIGGAGGGSGGYSRKTLPAALVQGGVIVTVGAGGLGQPAAAGGVTGGPATAGGATSFGAFCMANGGGPGGGAGTGGAGSPGLGAPYSTLGDIGHAGTPGMPGQANYYDASAPTVFTSGGNGGSMWGGGGIGGQASVTAGVQAGGSAHNGPGGGGGGAAAFAEPVGATAPGGNGGSGSCIVTEYCWGDGSDVVCGDPNRLAVDARVTLAKDWGPPGDCGPGGPRGGPGGPAIDPSAYGWEE